MTINKLALGGLAVVNLISSATTLFAADNNVTRSNLNAHPTNTIDQVNSASLSSIESSWLALPHTCKAKGFNAEPTKVAVEYPNQVVVGLYQTI